ncbi:UDP-N-acetylmuramoyl-L-alanine--D-glutamate ligase [Rhodovulum sp. DZ06]|uniref:UDP-N-acetylmuramoyl-L-alanine--D-glutamate ligase n=1 Tax=Rhodovulum sp. DZ06 TaxID=3425126 RepID=UPI003D3360C4
MITLPPSYKGRKVGVLGLGRSGLAAARALEDAGAVPICWDDGEGGRAAAAALGLRMENLASQRTWEGEDAPQMLIVSPGIPHLYPAPHPAVRCAWAAGAPVDNDVGLFFEAWAETDFDDYDDAPKIICVTGSNGKSTTTALIAHLLTEAGRHAQAGGNIGRAVFDLEIPDDGGVVVLELSSYQTELARRLAPDVACFINLSPDHLDRHGGEGGYFAAKARLFTLGAPEVAVVGTDQEEGLFLADRCLGQGGQVVRVASGRKPSGLGREVVARKGFLSETRGGKQTSSVDLRGCRALQGAHNHQNAAIAWAACRSLNIPPKVLEKGLHSFPGLPHRMERVGEAGGVLFVNDSKATNADAAEKALGAYDKVRWILGGVPKAGGIDPLRPLFGKVAKAYLIGEAAGLFAQTLGHAVEHDFSETLEAALDRAAAEALPGEVVLLSPACASFDQFQSFEARGDAFRARAQALIAAQGGALEGAGQETKGAA